MSKALLALALASLLCASTFSFSPPPAACRVASLGRSPRSLSPSASALGGAPPPASEVAASSSVSEGEEGKEDGEVLEIPTVLPSDMGMDYVPLATMLATGQLAEADQFTRDALIVLAGSKEKGRDFVYFTEVKNIPSTDL